MAWNEQDKNSFTSLQWKTPPQLKVHYGSE